MRPLAVCGAHGMRRTRTRHARNTRARWPQGDFQLRPEFYLGDNHHLNARGHAALAALLAPAIQRALDGRPAAAPPPDRHKAK